MRDFACMNPPFDRRDHLVFSAHRGYLDPIRMGQPDLFAKRTFAEETERITQGAVTWEDPPEIRLERVQSDGFLVVRRAQHLASLAAPWPAASAHDEVMVEVKMPGDHLAMSSVERALLRRQARQVQRVEEHEPVWPGDEPLWVIAPHVPQWLGSVRSPVRFAPGCYRIEPLGHWLVWIAANELPLQEELLPFLVARSGRALSEFILWVADRRPLEWVITMLESTSMPALTREELERKFPPTDDPVRLENRRQIIGLLLAITPQVKQELLDEGRLTEARAAVRRVLSRHKLSPSPEEEAQIEACTDLPTLARWLEQALTAATVAEALRT
ncbi:hypothetical protein [Chondromyces crocatus]|uniref:Uncharacterized protein n=1 Tax=Chondromyces crocatus TaxID=52 RepID=A0A0K1EM27_CHOCO|nr:hypothetical protein [Chondromyces crocatus]AKT41668.1 uncharacterized protein CMC5_058740 [Chondromyces crocatus]